jgi:hypothetical protein
LRNGARQPFDHGGWRTGRGGGAREIAQCSQLSDLRQRPQHRQLGQRIAVELCERTHLLAFEQRQIPMVCCARAPATSSQTMATTLDRLRTTSGIAICNLQLHCAGA